MTNSHLPKITYLTSNPGKVEEANRHFVERYGFEVEIMNPDFELLEIQAASSVEVVKFTVEYACKRLSKPVLKSDTALYIDYLGGLPGPYNAFFDKQIGTEKFIELMKGVTDRSARLEHSFAYCEPGKEAMIFTGGSTGRISEEPRGGGRWHNSFYIPDGEERTLSEIKAEDELLEASYWGTAIDDFAEWYLSNYV